MRKVSDSFIAASRSAAADPSIRVTLSIDGKDTVLGPESVQSANITYSDSGDFTIGGTASAGVELVMLSEALPSRLSTARITVEIGYPKRDGTWGSATRQWKSATERWDGDAEREWLQMGVFETSDRLIGNAGLFTTVQAYDAFYWMNERCDVSTPAVDGTATLSTLDYAKSLAKSFGFELDESSVNDAEYKTVRPSGTLRDCISQDAMACFQNAWAYDGFLEFGGVADTGMEVQTSDYVAGGFARSTGERVSIDHVQTTVTKAHGAEMPDVDVVTDEDGNDITDYQSAADSMQQGEDEDTALAFPLSSTGMGMEVDGKLFAGGSVNVDAKPAVWEAVGDDLATMAGLAGFPIDVLGFSCELWGWPFLRPYDRLKVHDANGGTANVVATTVEVAYDGAVRTTIGATAASDDEGDASSGAVSASVEAPVDVTDPMTELLKLQAVEHQAKQKALRESQTALRTDLDASEKRLEAARTKLDENEKQLNDARTRLAEAEEDLKSAQAELKTLNDDLGALETELDDSNARIEKAQSTADSAASSAATATKTANGKNSVYAKATEPVAADAEARGLSGFDGGDMWYETDTNGQIKSTNIWNGTEWTPYQLVADSVLVPSSVGSTLIADGAITTKSISASGISASVITSGELDSKIVSAMQIDGSQIVANSITGDKISANGISAGLITSGELNSSIVRTMEIDGSQITANSITTEKIATEGLDASVITTGTLGAKVVESLELNASQIVSGTIDAKFIDLDGLRTGIGWFGTGEDGNTVKVDGTGMSVTVGGKKMMNISGSGIDGVFYTGKSMSFDVSIDANAEKTYSFTRTMAMDNGGLMDIPWRPYALSRLVVIGSKYVSLGGWNCNPGGSETLFTVRLVNRSVSSKRDVRVAFQILWLKGDDKAYDQADTGSEATGDADSHGNDHFVMPTSDGNQKLGMSRSGSTLSITWKDA